MIVDTHVHVWEIDPPRYPVGPTAPNWSSLPDEPGTADELLAEMDQHGVDVSVLVQTSWSTWDNGYIADSVQRFPQRFVGMGLVDPLDKDNVETVRYWMDQRGLAGFRFHPMYYSDQKVMLKAENGPMLEELAARQAILQFHMGADCADQVAYVAERHPQLTCLVDHLGYPDLDQDPVAFEPIVALARHANVMVKVSDVAGRSKQEFPYADVHPFIERLYRAYGSQRLLWGTGYPGHHRLKHNWPSLADELHLIREGIPFFEAADRDRVLGGTAAQVWGLGR
jgi:L-fuconolactonase